MKSATQLLKAASSNQKSTNLVRKQQHLLVCDETIIGILVCVVEYQWCVGKKFIVQVYSFQAAAFFLNGAVIIFYYHTVKTVPEEPFTVLAW